MDKNTSLLQLKFDTKARGQDMAMITHPESKTIQFLQNLRVIAACNTIGSEIMGKRCQRAIIYHCTDTHITVPVAPETA